MLKVKVQCAPKLLWHLLFWQSQDHEFLMTRSSLYCHFWNYGLKPNSSLPLAVDFAKARDLFFLANMSSVAYAVGYFLYSFVII
jgi:hypothetical protein